MYESCILARLERTGGEHFEQGTVNSSTFAQAELQLSNPSWPLRTISRCHCVELLRLPFRDAQRLPCRALEVFGQKNDLPNVVRVMCDLAIDRLHDRVRFATDRHSSPHVFGLQRIDGIENRLPPVLPPRHH